MYVLTVPTLVVSIFTNKRKGLDLAYSMSHYNR